jgi:hypothetical protein
MTLVNTMLGLQLQRPIQAVPLLRWVTDLHWVELSVTLPVSHFDALRILQRVLKLDP